jgi:hypothetical protein
MTKKANKKGHGEQILDLMRTYDLFATGTSFRPKKKLWQVQHRRCNATYIQKDEKKRPTKLDYLCASNRWKSMVMSSEVRWGPSMHRFGQKFDHGFLSSKWRWRTKKTEKQKRFDLAAMNSQSWPAFDEDLRIRLQKKEEPRGKECKIQIVEAQRSKESKQELEQEYDQLTKHHNGRKQSHGSRAPTTLLGHGSCWRTCMWAHGSVKKKVRGARVQAHGSEILLSHGSKGAPVRQQRPCAATSTLPCEALLLPCETKHYRAATPVQ